MKILMLGWELPPHNSGGLGVACLNMAKALANEGADIEFILPYKSKHPEIDFMSIHSALELDPLYRYGGGAYESVNINEEIIPEIDHDTLLSIRDVQHRYCEYVDNYLEKHHPDVIHAHDWLTYEAGIIAKKKHNVPLIAHVHATEFDRAGMNNGNPIIHEIEYEGLMMADRIIAVSEITKRIIHEKYHIPLSKIEVVYNSIDAGYQNDNYEFIKENHKYIESLKDKGYIVISTVGRFTIQKGMQNLMRAAALALEKNPKLVFVFAGDGEQRNQLIRLASDLGISKNVLFTGFIRGKQLKDVYEVSDIFVMSSISEPFGLTALEAARHGDALILTKQSGVSEVIWSAFKYDFWDIQKLAKEILLIANNPRLLKVLQQNVKYEYQRISWEDIAKKCLKIYQKTTERK